MTPEEEKLYWKGNYFPSSLTENEFSKWIEIKEKYETPPSDAEQEKYGKILIIFSLFLSLSMFIIG